MHRHRNGEPALPGARRAEPESDHVAADGIDVALLAGGLRADRLALRTAHDLIGEHAAGALVLAHHLDAAPDARLIEVLALLQEHYQLLAQPPSGLGLRTIDGNLVAAHDHRGVGERCFDQPEVCVTLADERGHQMRAREDDGVGLRERRHSGVTDNGLIRRHGSELAAVPDA